MSQISPPIRIVLVAAIALMAAWFLFLRPGTEPVAPPAPAAGLGAAVDGANQAAATANAAAANPATATANPASATQTAGAKAPAAAKPAAKVDAELGLPRSVAKAMAKNQTLVMLFWNKNAYDDQAVRREVRKIDRRKGKVKVHVASINDVARYASITRGVNLEQSPTVVIVKGKSADALVGYVDAASINQSVSDVIRTGRGDTSAGPSNPYLAAINGECLTLQDQVLGSVEAAVSVGSLEGILGGAASEVDAAKSRVAKLRVPKKYRAFERDFHAYLDDVAALLRSTNAELKAVKTPDQLKALIQKMVSQGKKLDAGMKKQFNKLGLDGCVE